MQKLSTGQKRHKKDLRRKKRHPPAKSATVSKRYHLPIEFLGFDAPYTLEGSRRKLSAVIWEFASPLLDFENQTDDEVHTSLSLAMVCWNMGLLGGDDYSDIFSAMMTETKNAGLSASDNKAMIEIVNQLVLSKRTIYRNDDRYIMDFTFSATPNGYHLQVLSTYNLPDTPDFSVNQFR